MQDDHLPTLFEILNRFSKAPLDLWSFYVFLKEQYGGVEYLEFWLDCASHTALCKEVAREIAVKSSLITTSSKNTNVHGSQVRESETMTGTNEQVPPSPGSSVLYNMLQQDIVEDQPYATADINNRISALSDERVRNKRDTVSRLSEILDNLHMPEYPDATATSPSRNAKLRHDIHNEYDIIEEESLNSIYERRRQRAGTGASNSLFDEFYTGLGVPQPPHKPPPANLTSGVHQPDPDALLEQPFDFNNNSTSTNNRSSDPVSFPSHISVHDYHGTENHNNNSNGLPAGPLQTSAAGGRQLVPKANRTLIRESAQQIINTYLTPKSPKEIELPSDGNGWSLANDIRHVGSVPGGLLNPRLFDNATAYVFEALEREALPAFLLNRGLSNIQPLSAFFRLISGLIALFGGFWLSFVFILLDWEPKSHRCWVILPFGIGMYLTFTSLYHIDPALAYLGLCEKDGGGVVKVEEHAVKAMQMKRSTFVMLTIVLCAAAFSVLFIFVPGHRL